MGINHEGEDVEVYRAQEVGGPIKPRTRDPRVDILGGGAVIKYLLTGKVRFSDHTIRKVEIVRESDSSVWWIPAHSKKERRESKVSQWGSYFDTFEEARSEWFNRVNKEVENTSMKLARLKLTLGQVFKMTEGDLDEN